MHIVLIGLMVVVVLVLFYGVMSRSRATGVDPYAPPTPELIADARRFARLLVSEIKHYNEHQVAEGRLHRDLYTRLQDEIDGARETFEQRVAPAILMESDPLYDALVEILADGDEGALAGYDRAHTDRTVH